MADTSYDHPSSLQITLLCCHLRPFGGLTTKSNSCVVLCQINVFTKTFRPAVSSPDVVLLKQFEDRWP